MFMDSKGRFLALIVRHVKCGEVYHFMDFTQIQSWSFLFITIRSLTTLLNFKKKANYWDYLWFEFERKISESVSERILKLWDIIEGEKRIKKHRAIK